MAVGGVGKLDPAYGRGWLIFSGIVSVLFGIALLVAPLIGAVVLTWWLGAYALVTTGIPHIGRPGHVAFNREIKEVIKHVAGVRRTGSAALDLAWVAAGRFDAYWERGIKPWDMAAGTLIVEEAGGLVTGLDGAPFQVRGGQLACANPTLHPQLIEVIREQRAGRR